MTPSRSSRSAAWSPSRRAPLHQDRVAHAARLLAGQQVVEDRHPDRDAGRDLLEHGRLGGVGGVGGDLEAAVHRAGVADRHVGAEHPQPVAGQAVADGVLPRAGEEAAAHPLALDPQHHHGVGRRAAPRRGRTTWRSRPRPTTAPTPLGISVGGATTVTSAPSLVRQQHVAAEDAAVGEVADDRDVAALERAEAALQRVGVEQGLGGVLVGAVAGVDDRGVDPLADLQRRAAGRVAHHQGVDAHGGDGAARCRAGSRPCWPSCPCR